VNRRRIILGALFAVPVGAPCSAPAALAEQADEPKFNFRLSAVPFDVTGKLRLAGAGEGRLERPPPVRIVGCRNGSFSGLVVVSSPEPLRGLAAEVSDLARRQAGGTLPKGCVRVRWAILDGAGGFFDTLDDTPPEKIEMDPKTGALVRPMWITVTVPGDAGPGEYAGRVTVSAEGLGQTEVRLQLKVIDWTLPEPKDFASHVGIVQSPDSVAARSTGSCSRRRSSRSARSAPTMSTSR